MKENHQAQSAPSFCLFLLSFAFCANLAAATRQATVGLNEQRGELSSVYCLHFCPTPCSFLIFIPLFLFVSRIRSTQSLLRSTNFFFFDVGFSWRGQTVALKQFRAPKGLLNIENEVRLHQSLHHLNITECYGRSSTPGGQELLVLEWMPHTLENYSPSECQRQKIAAGTVAALSYLHSKKICHGDLKPANILLSENVEAKLSDMGLSRVIQTLSRSSSSQHQGLRGTMAFAAPEQLQGKDADLRSDIFSLAILLWELLTGKNSFPIFHQAMLQH